MAEPLRTRTGSMTGAGVGVAVDAGLRAYMLKVYNYMASAMLLTGMVAYATAHSPAMMQAIFGTPLFWVVVLAPLGLVFALSAGIHRMKASTAQTIFWIYAGLMGLSLASIFVAFTGTSIARVFFITAAAFGGLSLYGYTTKRNLSGFGTFLVMGLIGLIVASLVNLFLQSTGLQFVISAAGVLIFAGLTAYDTQNIKELYLASDSSEAAAKKSVMGALRLYLDFLNLFLFLLQFLGERR